MIRLLLLHCSIFLSLSVLADTIYVSNIDELNVATKQAKPGDVIILRNGEWNNVTISLTCSGTEEKPITFKAESAGKVMITGNSQLRLGGDYLIINGFYFTNGYAGNDAIITFRANKDHLANNNRVTNCVINDFNNPKRMDENYWIAFYGKKNRLDHCSFFNKKNIGVLLAVILDDDRSRENFHSIDHNYFGFRLPLASNGGEIIRVGVSQHCQFNSNTQITDNFFEHCDGEAEVISIKSGDNVVRNNLFKECQGSVVLRHGDNNTVENNVFIGNGKEGTGGVRVINKGQWVVNNFFYGCRGSGFRSPLTVMNGIPNSPAFRYVQVQNAVIANNTFYNCSPASFCEGSDSERTLPPQNVYMVNNTFYNDKDKNIYKTFDNINGFHFAGNGINKEVRQVTVNGFMKTNFTKQIADKISLPIASFSNKIIDSLQDAAKQKLNHPLALQSGFSDMALLKKILTNASSCGAQWFDKTVLAKTPKLIPVNCRNTQELYDQLDRHEPVKINLTGTEYTLDKPFVISKMVSITSNNNSPVKINCGNLTAVFVINAGGNLSLRNISIDGSGVKAMHFISSSSSGSSSHYNLSMRNCSIKNLDRSKGCNDIFYVYKYMVADSIVIRNNTFSNNTDGIIMTEEKDNKGYYNAEEILINHNSFVNQNGKLIDIYRGGNDESTMGPLLIFSNNKLNYCDNKTSGEPLISLFGVQRSEIKKNNFTLCNEGSLLITYKDLVSANHQLKNNILKKSGSVSINKYVQETGNILQ